MSLVMFMMLGAVFIAGVLARIVDILAQQARQGGDKMVSLALSIVSVGLFLGALTVVPMFQYTGQVSMEMPVILSMQAGVIVFVVVVGVLD